MSDLVIVQSRMGSERLPGKSFALIKEKPVLEHLLESVLRIFSTEQIVVVTSTSPDNDIIEKFCTDYSVNVFRGDEENVASRYYEVMKDHTGDDYFFRICGDSPMYDYRCMVKGFDIVKEEGKYDIVTSLVNKGYPQGMNLEMIRIPVFLRHYCNFAQKKHFEHVTAYFYDRINEFSARMLFCDVPGYSYEKYKFSVDTQPELIKMKSIFDMMSKPHFEYTLAEKCKMYLNNTIM